LNAAAATTWSSSIRKVYTARFTKENAICAERDIRWSNSRKEDETVILNRSLIQSPHLLR
jgi:hypothetical protein